MCSSPKSSGAKPRTAPAKGVFSSISQNAQASFTNIANQADERRQRIHEERCARRKRLANLSNIPTTKRTKGETQKHWLYLIIGKDLLSVFTR